MIIAKCLKFIGLISICTLLFACSDDGDTDSGSGSDNGTTDAPLVENSPFQGIFNGTARIKLSALGQSVDESGAGSLRVFRNGRVGGSVVDDRGDLPCTTTSNRPVVNANGRFTYIETGTCDASSEGLGTCDVSIAVNGAINGNRLTANGPVELKCNIATATGSVTFSGNRG